MKRIALVIENIDKTTEWGVSFDGPNPKVELYVECETREAAFVLSDHVNSDALIACPFCGEKGFDFTGLSIHLAYHCPVYRNAAIMRRIEMGGK